MDKHPFGFAGKTVHVVGPRLKVGDKAPDFRCHRFVPGTGLVEIGLADAHGGKATLFSVVPSIDTPVCSTQTQKFNQQIAALADKARCYTVSCDLPFAQNRFCGDATHKIDNLQNLSDYRDRSFGKAFGVLIDEIQILARAVFVVDGNGVLTYVEYVPEAKAEPNYEAALAALQKAAG
ncbi:MAG TPA: thiol peroxidase [Gemmatales bacterium]|nr:thiol peroxidase [Gemmatales bacterium]HMP60982.1 thiol peroxidase [Gemmatales bacterium]